MSNTVHRVAYLVSHPIQYQAPMLRYLTGHPSIDLTVMFLSDLSAGEYLDPGFGRKVHWDTPLLDGYKHVFLNRIYGNGAPSFWNPVVFPSFSEFRSKYDVVWLHGYSHHALLTSLLFAKALNLKVLLRGESHLHSQSRSALKNTMKRQLFPLFFKSIDAFLAIGSLNREYYLHYGVPPDRIFDMPYAVDNDFFREQARAAMPKRGELKRQLGFSEGRPIILFASKLQPRKRAADLLEAYLQLSPDGRTEPLPYLLFVGDGEERATLESRANSTGWSSIRFVGFKNQSEIPLYYDLCDVFVLVSEHEPWGLVVNEVMNAGKPVIVTDQVGAAKDLVKDGVNGYVIPVGRVDRLAECLRDLTAEPSLIEKMGNASLDQIKTCSFQADLEGLLSAVEFLQSPCNSKSKAS